MSSPPARRTVTRLISQARGGAGWLRQHWFGLLVLATAAFLVTTEIYYFQPKSVRDLQWLMHSGAVVYLIALAAARCIPQAVPETVRRLRTTDVDGVEVQQADQILAALNRVRIRYARVGVPCGVVLMTMFWVWAAAVADLGHFLWFWLERVGYWRTVRYVGRPLLDNPLFWVELVGSGVAGYVVGGFVAYGRLGHVLTAMQLKAVASPGHPDGAAGLRPVGSLYLRQALIVSFIGLFAGIWWLLFPLLGRYRDWGGPYLGVVLTCVVLEGAALYLPLLSFHRQMRDQRTALLPDADAAARQIEQIDATRARTTDSSEAAELQAERERVLARWQSIDSMPTWPIDSRIRKRFAWSNIAMLIPVLLQLLNAPQALQQLSSAFAG